MSFSGENNYEGIHHLELSEQQWYLRFRSEIERTIIETGIQRLFEILQQIKGATGSLPRTVIFPDTSARPLAYAVDPLLKAVYAQEQIEFPQKQFCPTYRIKKNSGMLDELEETGIDLEEKEKKDEFLRDKGFLETIKNRLTEIIQSEPTGPILIVEDIVSRGETFETLSSLLEEIAPQLPVYFFSFLKQGKEPLNWSIPEGHYCYGVSSIPVEVQELGRKKSLDARQSALFDAWMDVMFDGFQYRRFGKTESLGVEKDIFSESLYSYKSSRADHDKIREVRQWFADAGKKALDALDFSVLK